MTERRSGGTAAIALDGAIDMHCHFGPEPLVEMAAKTPHSVDPVEAAREAADHGMKAIVLKAHEFPPSTVAAHLANKAVPEVQSISGICLDHPVGGLNPHAVECALRAGAKVVWLPTISSQQDAPAKVNAFFGVQEGIRVIDADGELLPEVRTILDLITQYDAVLATGHVSTAEHFAVAREYGTRGRVLVTHAMHATTGPPPDHPGGHRARRPRRAHRVRRAHMHGRAVGVRGRRRGTASSRRRKGRARNRLRMDTKVPHPAAGLHSYVNAVGRRRRRGRPARHDV